MEQVEIIFTEIKDKDNNIQKKIVVNDDLSLTKSPSARISNGTARTVTLTEDQVCEYLDGLNHRPDTCLVPAIWAEGKDFVEFDICLRGKEDPENGKVSRTSDFFQFANSNQISWMVLDIDGDYNLKQVHEFINNLQILLKDAIISKSGTKKLMRFEKPSTSAGIKIPGKVSTGLHVYIPVKNMRSSLLKKIFRWSWLDKKYKSHKVTSSATIISRSIIDETVAAPARLLFEADAEVTGRTDLIEIVERKTNRYPGGVLDCELAEAILDDMVIKYEQEWTAYKYRFENTTEYRNQKQAAVKARTAKLMLTGLDKSTANRRAFLVFENHVVVSSDYLTRTDGTQVEVYDILVDRDSWLGQKNFVDYLDPKIGTNKAMIAGGPQGVFLRSFAHGGINYFLKFDADGIRRWMKGAELAELLECFSDFISQSSISGENLDLIFKEYKAMTDVTVTTVKKTVIDKKKEVEQARMIADAETEGSDSTICTVPENANQDQIAADLLRSFGSCRSYGSEFYVAEKAIWRTVRLESIKERAAIRYSHCKRCQTVNDYNAIAKYAVDRDVAYTPHWEHTLGIPCASQFLKVGSEIGGGAEYVPYDLELGCRFKLGFNPDPECPTPYWNKVLENVVNPRCFQQGFGLALAGYLNKLQKVLVLKGAGGTGKGTTNRILTAMLPAGRVTAVSIEQMADDKAVIPLVDSVINFIPEIRKNGAALSTEGFKKVTGGDKIQAHRMWKGPVDFFPIASHVININDWPSLDSAEDDMRRRLGWFIVEFEKTQSEDVENIAEMIIQHELPGVLAWAIEGIKDHFENGFDTEHSFAMWGAWTGSFDIIGMFLDECCENREGKTLRSGLYDVFHKFCDNCGCFAVKSPKFNAAVMDKFRKCRPQVTVKKTDGGQVFLTGIELNEIGKEIARSIGYNVLSGKSKKD